jgi:hypothetical protein
MSMPARRTSFELSVEGEAPGANGGPPLRARLSVAFEPGPTGGPPSAEEVRTAIEELRASLAGALGVPVSPAPRADRGLPELIETYRPRQPELIDLLRDEGELTTGEHALLAGHLSRTPGPVSQAPSPSPPMILANPPPLASAPAEVERAPSGPARPVPVLLEQYRITSLKQAGAVRARRQISFDEYMAIKRHYAATVPVEGSAPPA